MEREITFRFTEEEYETLKEEMERSGQEIETLIHEWLGQIRTMQLATASPRLLSKQELAEYLYDEGILESVPMDDINSEEIEIKRKHLADFFGKLGGKSASEMIIEDRGPY